MSRTYHLELFEEASRVFVKEAFGCQLLPKACADRHINLDGTFCLGLRAGQTVTDDVSAAEWWSKLQVFLTYQETAQDSGYWPMYAQLSHGEEAAELQLEAEEAASELGLRDVYDDALRADHGLIAKFVELINPATKRLRNGRARCVCGRVDKRGRPLLRRDCWKLGKPCLPALEFRRREAVSGFWAVQRSAGVKCCGTMRDCPLR